MKLYLLDQNKTIENEIELTPPAMVLGREVDTDVHVMVPGVSRYHCKFEFDGENWTVSDLNSTNGTKVNRELIEDTRILFPGDTIDVGDQLIRFGETSPNAKTEINGISRELAATVLNSPPVVDFEIKEDTAEESFTILDTTDTIKNVPRFNVPGSMEAPPSTPPKVIINMPGQSSGGNPIIFEPIQDSPTLEKFDISSDKTIRCMPEKLLNPEPSESTLQPAPEKSKTEKHSTPVPDKGNENEESFDMASLKKLGLFGGSGKKKATPEDTGKEPDKKRKRFSDLLFYVIVICIAAIVISIFIMFNRKPANTAVRPSAATSENQTDSLVIIYEKKIISNDNIFRFSMVLDNGSVEFALDDLNSERHFVKEDKKVKPELIKSLLSDIKATSFLELPPQAAGYPRDGKDERRIMKIGYGNQFKEVTIANNSIPNSFESIEQSITIFAEEYGLHTISMTPEELKAQAEIAFNKAEELFKNRDARPENLQEALKRYKLTMEFLDQFAPKPQAWELSKRRISEAQGILTKRINDLKFDYSRYIRLKDYDNALLILKSLIPLLDLDSKDYSTYQKYQQRLELTLSRRQRR
ncbi:MAG: FHA domain-containing protein [Victivallales bacterium]|nr:FHA domain-containing protein [Victivallales bacterium]